MLDFSRLEPPPQHGDVLVEPPARRLPELARRNHELIRSYTIRVIDRDVSEIRASLRQLLCDGCEGTTVLTGHQPEFIHAGVWAKHIVAASLSAVLGGKVINFIVDSDAPKHAALNVPYLVDSGVRAEPVRYASLVHGGAYEGIPPLDREACREFASNIRRLMAGAYHTSSMPRYLAALNDAEDARDWVDQMVFARRQVERDFGVEMIEQRVSRVWFGPLLADMMLHARRFAECYNASLTAYRSRYRIRGVNRPIPDLVQAGSRCELPVWVYRLAEPRRRLFVERFSDSMHLFAGHDRFGEVSVGDLAQWERAKVALENQSGFLFRPRALSLTLWARVFVGDLFIHGIGGAKYDRITDEIIRRYYAVEPPAMACVSATMLMDVPCHDVAPTSLSRARARLRDVRYNPQRHLKRDPVSAALIDQRVAAVSRSVNLRAHSPKARQQRRAVFEQIRDLNARLVALDPSVLAEKEATLRHVQEMLARNKEARRRDYFFAMLDRTRLQELVAKLSSKTLFGV